MELLAHRIREGDSTAEGRLVRAYSGRIRALALNRAPRDWCDDIVQESLRRVLVAVRGGDLRDEGSLGAFVLGVARNVIQDLLRRDGRRKETSLHAMLPAPASETSPPLERLLRRDAVADVRACLRELRPDDREILRLTYEENRRPREIAAALGISPKAARQRKWRAHRRFEARWRARCRQRGVPVHEQIRVRHTAEGRGSQA